MIKKSRSKWFAHQTAHPEAEINLICFVFAGGSPSFFAPWKALFPEWINIKPVLYPMREKRAKDRMPDSMEGLVEQFFQENQDLLKKDYAVWGHCSGALLGMEFARMMEKAGKAPTAFIVSGCEAPQYALLRLQVGDTKRDFSEITDEEILSDLDTFNLMDKDMLANETFRQYFLPIYRADLEMFSRYYPEADAQISCPAIVMNGTEDSMIKRDAVGGWADYFSQKTIFQEYPGEHYFVNDQKEFIAGQISKFLKQAKEGWLPLLPQQKRLLKMEQAKQSRGCQNTGIVFELQGAIDESKFDWILEVLGKRHDAFDYTLVEDENGRIYQKKTGIQAVWHVHDLSDYEGEDVLEEALKQAKKITQMPMNLFGDALYEFHRYHLAKGWILLHIKASHLLADGPSLSVLYKEIGELYCDGAFKEDIVGSWKLFVEEEIAYMESTEGKKDIDYWKQYCGKGNDFRLSAATIKNLIDTTGDEEITFSLPMLQQMARKYRTSIFNLILFVYNVALAEIFEQDVFGVSYTITNRFHKEMRNVIGLSTHHVSHYLEHLSERTLKELLSESKKQINESFHHFIMGESVDIPEFTLSYLSQVVSLPEWGNVTTILHPMNSNLQYANTNYTLMCSEVGEQLEFVACADPQIYSVKFKTRLLKCMEKIINKLWSDEAE